LVSVRLDYREGDGAAWVEDGAIVINVKWINVEEEAEWYIDESFIHEYVEHVLGLGHSAAVYVEKALRKLLYREWYGVCPLSILYGDGGEASRERASSPPAREAPQPLLSQPQGV